MRILFLAHRLPYPPNKGDKIRSFWELKTLSRHHEIDLFCFYDDPQDKVQVANLRPYCRVCYAEPVSVLASRARAVSALIGGQPFSTAYFFSRTMARRVAQAVRARSYDLIFVFGSVMAQYAASLQDIPRILDMVDVDSDKWAQYSKYRGIPLSWLWMLEARRLERYEADLVSGFSNTLICTEGEARLLRSKARRGRITVLQNSLDMNYYQPEAVSVPDNIRALQPYAIFTGTMDYFPNVDAVQFFCSDVLPRVRLRVPDLRFVIAGRNPSPQVMRLAENPSIVVTGALPDIRPYVRGAAVAVAPMRIARGVQNKILEALAMDVPVVASSLAATALPKELASLLAAEDEPAPMADRIADYVLDPPPRIGNRHTSVKRYVEALDLGSQLEQLLRRSAAQSIRAREDQVALAV